MVLKSNESAHGSAANTQMFEPTDHRCWNPEQSTNCWMNPVGQAAFVDINGKTTLQVGNPLHTDGVVERWLVERGEGQRWGKATGRWRRGLLREKKWRCNQSWRWRRENINMSQCLASKIVIEFWALEYKLSLWYRKMIEKIRFSLHMFCTGHSFIK